MNYFPQKIYITQPSHTLHVGFLKEENKILDEVVVSVYKNPTSYTGENVVEISCHGSAYVQQIVIEAIIKKWSKIGKAG